MTETMKRIKAEVALQEITHRELADRTGYTECSISRWLNDKRTPTIDVVETIAEALGYRVELM